MLRAIIGIILIAAGIGLAVTQPPQSLTLGVFLLVIQAWKVVSLGAPLKAAWPLFTIPTLFVIGAILLLGGLDRLVARKRGKKGWLVLVIGWSIAYLAYTVSLALSGRTMLLDSFDFQRLVDLVYLLLLAFFVAIVLRLTVRPHSLADVAATLLGLFGGAMLAVPGNWWGPDGLPDEHPLRIVAFIAFPIWLLTYIGLLAMVVNLARSLCWRVRERRSDLRKVQP